jgi:catechol 2,3-dioxygenase-like lactoylglutathione lyase family enzyme
VDKLGGKIVGSQEAAGAPQIYVTFGQALVTVRGQRPGEEPAVKPGFQWGIDHFGVRVNENKDFEKFCDGLRSSGVKFLMEPQDFGETAKVAYIEDPDGVKIELVFLKKQPPTA